MRIAFIALSLESDLIQAHARLDEMFRHADLFTSNEVDRQQKIRTHLAAALEETQMLTNSVLQRANSQTVFDLADRPQSAPIRITEER